jgi:hypothetical protein
LGESDKTTNVCLGLSWRFSKEHFLRVGGYEPVKDRWVENFDLSDHFQSAQIPMACYAGKGSLSNFVCIPVELKDIAQGWGKSFAMGGKGTPQGCNNSCGAYGLRVLWEPYGLLIGAVIQGDSLVHDKRHGFSMVFMSGEYTADLKQIGAFRFT